MENRRPLTLGELIQDTVLKCRQGAAAIAEYLNKAPSTLYNELNPNPDENRTHKLGLLDWVRILRLTGDHRSLHKVCAELGHVAVPIPACHLHKADWLRLQAKDAKEYGEAAHALLEALSAKSPGGAELTREERRTCAQEYYEAALAALTIWEALRDEE